MIHKLPNIYSLGGTALKRLTGEKLNELIEYQTPIILTGRTIVVWDMVRGYNADLLLDENKTLFFQQLTPGDYGTIKLTQDAIGGRTLTLPSNSIVMGTQGSSTLILSTNADYIDIATFYYDGVNLWWNLSKY